MVSNDNRATIAMHQSATWQEELSIVPFFDGPVLAGIIEPLPDSAAIVDSPANGFKSLTIRHTVQRKTSKYPGHLTNESHVAHLPVTTSFSPASEGAPLAAAINSLELGRMDGPIKVPIASL